MTLMSKTSCEEEKDVHDSPSSNKLLALYLKWKTHRIYNCEEAGKLKKKYADLQLYCDQLEREGDVGCKHLLD